MDREEDIDRDREGDRLGDRNVDLQRVSETETDREMSALAREYDIVNSDGEVRERSPPTLELVSHYKEYIRRKSLSPPIHRTLPTPPSSPPLYSPSAMDIPSVRFQPGPVKAQAVITSTHGHPSLIWPVRPKVNTCRLHGQLYATEATLLAQLRAFIGNKCSQLS